MPKPEHVSPKNPPPNIPPGTPKPFEPYPDDDKKKLPPGRGE